jgi:hypothetical protein
MSVTVARRMWAPYEPIHALTSFAPAALAAAHDLGTSFWARYVAQRGAPSGEVPAAVVVAAFGGFAPARIAARTSLGPATLRRLFRPVGPARRPACSPPTSSRPSSATSA